jgi:hypothetical protein
MAPKDNGAPAIATQDDPDRTKLNASNSLRGDAWSSQAPSDPFPSSSDSRSRAVAARTFRSRD